MSRYPCEAAGRPLLPIAGHAYELYRLLEEDDVLAVGGSAADWMILAAGLSDVSIQTAGLDPQDAYCSNPFEEARGPAVSAVATELARLLFLWGAVEVLMAQALPPRRKKEEHDSKRMSRLAEFLSPSLLHHDCAAWNLLQALDGYGHEEFANAALRARQLNAGPIAQGTLAAYNVRNSLAHGSLPWPDDDPRSRGGGVIIGRLACRMMLFAAQKLLLHVVSPSAETRDWPDDEEHIRVRLVRDVLPHVHLASVGSSADVAHADDSAIGDGRTVPQATPERRPSTHSDASSPSRQS